MNYDLIKDTNLNLSLFNKNFKNKEDFVFVDYINKKKINLDKNINILFETEKNGFLEQNINIDFDYFIGDIKSAFKTNDEIKHQFEIDLPRCNIFLNKYKIDNSELVYEYLLNKFGKEITTKIIMLTTQALLGLPFQIIFENINKDNYYLTEMEKKSKNSFRIRIDIENKNIYFKAYKELRIFYLDEIKGPINKFRVFIKLDFNLNELKYVFLRIKTTKY